MTLQWIDRGAGVAYVVVHGQMPAFVEFLNAIDRLIADPAWHPGTPIIEDLRDYRGYPPPNCVEQWRWYVGERRGVLSGCRWAIVRRDDDPGLLSILNIAAEDAAPHAVVLQQFTNMVDAHLWVDA